jgi:hypothetical protein
MDNQTKQHETSWKQTKTLVYTPMTSITCTWYTRSMAQPYPKYCKSENDNINKLAILIIWTRWWYFNLANLLLQITKFFKILCFTVYSETENDTCSVVLFGDFFPLTKFAISKRSPIFAKLQYICHDLEICTKTFISNLRPR